MNESSIVHDMHTKPKSVAIRSIGNRILTIRARRVMIDEDLARLYGVSTKAVNQAVARNPTRFPRDFAFRLSRIETANLKSQSVTSSSHGGRRKLPRVFTEQGVAMLSSVLKSPRATSVNVAIMRAFVRLRQLALTHADLTRQIADLERKYDGKFAIVFDAIRQLTAVRLPDDKPRPRIGFVSDRMDPAGSARHPGSTAPASRTSPSLLSQGRRPRAP